MKVYELLLLLGFLVVILHYWKHRKLGFRNWLLEYGVFSYLIKSLLLVYGIVRLLILIVSNIDLSFLNTQLWN